MDLVMSEERRRTVKMCVCHRKKFSEIFDLAQEKRLSTLNELIRDGIAGGGCGMCHPYIKKMLITGETSFVPGDLYIPADVANG